jgi:hypothetical protein
MGTFDESVTIPAISACPNKQDENKRNKIIDKYVRRIMLVVC